jgi:hypothetical protein
MLVNHTHATAGTCQPVDSLTDRLPAAAPTPSCSFLYSICTVCQCSYTPGDTQVTLPCRHVYHEDCIVQWLGRYSKLCPVCKTEVS